MNTAAVNPRIALYSALALVLGVCITAYGSGHPSLDWLPGMGSLPDLYEASIEELQEGLRKRRFTSVDLVKAYLARIDEVNLNGPGLRAVLETNPHALEQAAELDRERKTSGPRGPLHGIPILLKDNIATKHEEGMNTTAGSYALLGSVAPGDATVAAKLRAAGAILLGKNTLSEWAYWRGQIPSGFCGRLGQATNPYVRDGNPSGSSAGSAIAAALGLAAGALGSETDGSIISPSSLGNIVGLKPTVGLTSRAGVIPISEHQDSVGPMCRCVADAAAVLAAIVGRDPKDNYTLSQPEVAPDYTKALRKDGLKGARLGVPRELFKDIDANVLIAFDAALATVRALGATVVDPADLQEGWDQAAVWATEEIVLCGDFKENMNAYLAKLVAVPTGVRTVADIIAFNAAHADQELVEPFWTDQSTLVKSDATPQDARFWAAVVAGYRAGREDGIDGALARHALDALLLPTVRASRPAAVAGYPVMSGACLSPWRRCRRRLRDVRGRHRWSHADVWRGLTLAVPLGFQPPDVALGEANPTRMNGPGMPFGVAFLGTAYSEFKLIQYAYAYEQATKTRLQRRAYPEAIPKTQLVHVIGK
ncbi:amidase signature enzyme [Wolfiporia cocos MD-104 SS10]|uniref:Amidase signature enzyme n=1 Tax=Wolfiporia cocos (strain MD-104) TaxID=742152 RepID=A0A2H3JAE8_WOLCO|nr:amidase signature enzyme [Wolfiporia cocos MD-104 SS10]